MRVASHVVVVAVDVGTLAIASLVPSSGPPLGGNTVTISGARLGSNNITAISLAGAPITAWTWVSQTMVRMTAPSSGSSTSVTGPLVFAHAELGTSTVLSYTYLASMSTLILLGSIVRSVS